VRHRPIAPTTRQSITPSLDLSDLTQTQSLLQQSPVASAWLMIRSPLEPSGTGGRMVACRGLTPAPSPLFWHTSLPSPYWWLTGGLLEACWWLVGGYPVGYPCSPPSVPFWRMSPGSRAPT
jgi:hypothetical protein